MDIPGQDEPSGPGILIGLPSLLDSGLLAAAILGASTPVQAAADSNLEEGPVEDWGTLGRDDPALGIAAAQVTEILDARSRGNRPCK